MAEADWGTRDARGEWQPENLPVPGELFHIPPRPTGIARYLFAPQGFLWPYNLLVCLLAVASWLWLTPGPQHTSHLEVGWIALLWLRNASLIALVYGGAHLWLYVARGQGLRFKYTNRWLARGDGKFLFRSQLWDNLFFSVVSGCSFWTAYEALTLFAYTRGFIPRVDFRAHPVYCILLVPLIVLFRLFHFYWVHRLIHLKPLYGPVHSLHHKNVNVGPWSGLAMHPLEHLVYFSGVLLHWVLPSHPVHALFHLMHAGLTPVLSHAGFHKFVGRGDRGLMNDQYFHYLHHRYFTVNFGGEAMPLDQWFGTFHDGSPEAQAMMARRKPVRAVST